MFETTAFARTTEILFSHCGFAFQNGGVFAFVDQRFWKFFFFVLARVFKKSSVPVTFLPMQRVVLVGYLFLNAPTNRMFCGSKVAEWHRQLWSFPSVLPFSSNGIARQQFAGCATW